MPREMLWKKIERHIGRNLGRESAIFDENRFRAVCDSFQAEMGSAAWRIRIRDPFYMQIALRTPVIEAEISEMAKITIFMVWST